MNIDGITSAQDSLHETMRSGIFTNPDGRILIIHDTKIKNLIEWVEYHIQARQLHIIHQDGIPQSLGISIDDKAHQNLLNGTEVILKCIQNKQITHSQAAPLILQEY